MLSLLGLLEIGLLGFSPVVFAQNIRTDIPHNIPILLDPNGSQQFFQRGQDQLEREIKRLQEKPPLTDESILKIDESLLQQTQILELEHSTPLPTPNNNQ